VKKFEVQETSVLATGARIVARIKPGKAYLDSIARMDEAQIEKMLLSDDGWAETQRLYWENRSLGQRHCGYFREHHAWRDSFVRLDVLPSCEPEGGCGACWPMEFLCRISPAARTDALAHPEHPEIALQEGTTLVIPLWVVI